MKDIIHIGKCEGCGMPWAVRVMTTGPEVHRIEYPPKTQPDNMPQWAIDRGMTPGEYARGLAAVTEWLGTDRVREWLKEETP